MIGLPSDSPSIPIIPVNAKIASLDPSNSEYGPLSPNQLITHTFTLKLSKDIESDNVLGSINTKSAFRIAGCSSKDSSTTTLSLLACK